MKETIVDVAVAVAAVQRGGGGGVTATPRSDFNCKVV
jgi:hypothetical protein